MSWGGLVLLLTALVAGIVWFLGRLPEPPRYDDLRIEPGSTAKPIRAIRLSLEIAGARRAIPVPGVGFEDLGALMADAEQATRGRYRIPVLPEDAGLAIFGVESHDLAVRLLQDDRALLEGGGVGVQRFETDPVLLPTRASDLVLSFEVVGPAPTLSAWWRAPDGPERAFSELSVPVRDPS